MDDIVGRPIYTLLEDEAPPSLGEVQAAIQGLMRELPPAVAAIFVIRVMSMIDYADEVGANGFMLAGTTNLGKVSFFISEEKEDSILEVDIPEGLNHVDCQKWLINKISSMASERRLIVDPALCQCLCGYAGPPEEWVSILAL